MNVAIGNSGKEISWGTQSPITKKQYSDTLMGYEVLPDNSGILLLEPYKQVGPENAVIYNNDGSERWRLPFPKNLGNGLLFDRVGISDNELIVIGIINGRDVRFSVDFTNLTYTDINQFK